jgi:hypothetical protein
MTCVTEIWLKPKMINNMKRIILSLLLMANVHGLQAQEAVAREDALKYAFSAALDLKQMLGTPIPTDPDVKRPAVVKDGEYGGMILPETKLSAAVLEKSGKEVVPVGQLWLHKLAPLVDGQVTSQSKLLIARVQLPEGEASGPVLTLALQKKADGTAELLVYGKDKEPLFRVPAKSISGQDNGLEFAAERRNDSGSLTLKIAGKYEASFAVTDPDRF